MQQVDGIINKIPTKIWTLIATMTTNSQKFGILFDPYGKVKEVNTNSHIWQQICNLTTLVQQLALGQVKTCGIYFTMGQPTDICPTLQGEQANVIGGFLE